MSHLFHDIRGEGFARRARVSQALAWLLAAGRPTAGESVALADAGGRCLTQAVAVTPAASSQPLARRNGVALKAERTFGASSYDPVVLPVGEARPFQSGEPLPPGFDAVAPYDAVRLQGGVVEVMAALAPGENVQRAAAPTIDIAAGRPLTPPLLALLAAGGCEQATVHRKPRVRLAAVGTARSGPPDQTTAALAACIIRDGGVVTDIVRPDCEAVAVAAAFVADPEGCDVLLAVGRTGSGPDDIAPPALAAAGDIAFHGLALRPGGSTAVGRIGERPAILLPGQPLSALVAYALLVSPLLRRMAGCDPLPAPTPLRETFLHRKLASEPGMLDVFPVRLDEDGVAHALGDPWQLGPAALAADGVVLVAEDSEGLPAGAEAAVYSLDGALGCGEDKPWRI